MLYYTAVQNNSGGGYSGPLFVAVRASSYEEAREYIEVNYDQSFCSCCGRRWDIEQIGTEIPMWLDYTFDELRNNPKYLRRAELDGVEVMHIIQLTTVTGPSGRG